MIEFDENLRYTKNNEWAKTLDDVIRVGIDDYSQASLGDIVHVEIMNNGTHVTSGEVLGSIEATKSVSEINAPVSGIISRVNDSVLESPTLINLDPFGEGWLVEIKADNLAEIDSLMSVNDYKKFIAR
ncbi:MAG: glycine cleavage system protein GcvH [Synergistaceae bacterium]|nr:glycine cleavage system protein GcvH [Synergistaceae bacterium]